MFDPGNLVTLGIVVVILAIYRLLDRDNRSLEKVKKYADKLREDLAAFADLRAEDLKGYAVELEVHQKAAKEVLRRVQGVEEDLSSRADAIGAMASRIAEYDKALAELKDMSARVDENLAVIHDESLFVDGVARAVKNAREEMERIEAGIPALRQGFLTDADEVLARIEAACSTHADSAVEQARTAVSSLEARVERSATTVSTMHAEAAKAAVERWQAIDAELNDAFRRAREEGVRLEDASFRKLQEQIETRGSKLSDAIDARFDSLRDQAREKIAETQGLIKGFKSDWKKSAEALIAEARTDATEAAERIHARIDDAEARVEKVEASYDERCGRMEAKALETAQALQQKIKDALKAHQDDLSARQADVKAAIKDSLAEARVEGERALSAMEGVVSATKARVEAVAADQSSRLAALEAGLSAAERRGDAVVASLNAAFADRGSELEARVLAGFEQRAGELRGAVELGFERLETAQGDADRLEAGLREAMAAVQRRVEDDFTRFGQDLVVRQKGFEEEFRGETARLRSGVKDLEQGLDSLKSRAYADVSAQLKVFEDDFFADLKARSAETDGKLAAWRTEMDDRLSAALRESEAARAQAEQTWTDESRTRLAEAQARVQEQLDKLTNIVETHRSAISERMGEADEALSSLRNIVRADMDDARKAADAWLAAEMERWKHEAGERMRAAERAAAADSKGLEESLDAARARFEEVDAALAAEAGTWNARFAAAIETARKEKDAALSKLAASFKDDVAALTADWDAERRRVIETAKGERDALARDVRGLSDETGRLRQELAQKTAQALDDFQRSYDALAVDAQKRSRDALAETESALETYRREAKAVRDAFDASKVAMAASLDEERKEREKGFAELDRQVKAFQAQTRLFERADELKLALSDSIEAMKADLARAESRRAEMAELETQYSRIKRLEDELAQKIARFLAEKRRLDAMEDDFKRLITLSQGVDQKLAQVTSSSDQLAQIQAEMRRLSEAATEAAEKYDRVEKKSNLLDATADAVDRNFQELAGLEKGVRALDAEIRDIPDRVIDLKRSMDEIMAFEPRLDEAVGRMDGMTRTLAEAEKRAAELQKAREWLARAETRFEELNKKTMDHLKLLSDILKDEPARKEKGAPSLSVQETVRKLAHQGWKVEEIAKAVKLSRGEVELILELGRQD